MRILKFKEYLMAPDLQTRRLGAIILRRDSDPFRLKTVEKLFYADFIGLLLSDYSSNELRNYYNILRQSLLGHSSAQLTNARAKVELLDCYKDTFETVAEFRYYRGEIISKPCLKLKK